jgi:hypothetical protein
MFKLTEEGVGDCRTITDFTWHEIERRLNELVEGVEGLLRKPTKQTRMEEVVVVAISCNNYAQEHDLACRFPLD